MTDKKYIWKSFDFDGCSLDLVDLFHDQPHVFFFDSSQYDPHRGRYSFIGFDPFDVFIHKGTDTLDLLKEKFTQYVDAGAESFASPFSPLTAGAVGCIGYDYGLRQENIQTQSEDDLNLPDCFFGFYDCILTIDHFTQKLYVTSSGLPEKNKSLREKRAKQRMSYILQQLNIYFAGTWRDRQNGLHTIPDEQLTFKCKFSKDQYYQAVHKALDHIGCGDIYQVNVSQRFQLDYDECSFKPLSLYRDLRNLSPSPFGGYIDCGDFQLMSNSPERFLYLNNGVVQSRPMKGTRPRGNNEFDDQRYRKELLNSAKEKAELLMITDLLRNDLGRVCDYGSIFVREMRILEEYKYVFQATAMIEGVLNKNKDGFDLIRACFHSLDTRDHSFKSILAFMTRRVINILTNNGNA